jgi:hypothetical protein
MTYAIAITMIVAGALAACRVPARRAASIDAAVTLRADERSLAATERRHDFRSHDHAVVNVCHLFYDV